MAILCYLIGHKKKVVKSKYRNELENRCCRCGELLPYHGLIINPHLEQKFRKLKSDVEVIAANNSCKVEFLTVMSLRRQGHDWDWYNQWCFFEDCVLKGRARFIMRTDYLNGGGFADGTCIPEEVFLKECDLVARYNVEQRAEDLKRNFDSRLQSITKSSKEYTLNGERIKIP